ncbi:MAG: hypothetical protein ACI8YD_001504, partial [Rheinheimera aquimaris]
GMSIMQRSHRHHPVAMVVANWKITKKRRYDAFFLPNLIQAFIPRKWLIRPVFCGKVLH